MSRAFVKEIDDLPSNLAPRKVCDRTNFVTRNGLEQIERELAKYEAAHRAAVAKDNKAAIELTAREIAYWDSRKETAVLAPESTKGDRVQFGVTVTVRREGGRVQTFRIVGIDEADPSSGTISYLSPFAQAVIDRPVGTKVEIAGENAEILAIK